mmetsp:Transcript_6907/g.9025  ORF Transcript_6907/g.9025 Transcript_6907/m.9025 type:complete len:133 (-) Transcript_6907:119-517(-)
MEGGQCQINGNAVGRSLLKIIIMKAHVDTRAVSIVIPINLSFWTPTFDPLIPTFLPPTEFLALNIMHFYWKILHKWDVSKMLHFFKKVHFCSFFENWRTGRNKGLVQTFPKILNTKGNVIHEYQLFLPWNHR